MTFNPKKQHQQAHIARAYATAWKPADMVELPAFLATVNIYFEFDSQIADVFFDARRREVALETSRWDYRIILKPGVEPWGQPFKAITAEDVERFERRQAP